MATKLEIIQRAQVRVGDEPIESLDDEGASTYSAVFDSKRDDLISRYPWFFSEVIERLPRLSETPDVQYPYYYQLPSDMIGAPRAFYAASDCETPYLRYRLTQNRVATDAEELYLKNGKLPEPELWPGYFVELMTLANMTDLALSVREDRALYNSLFTVTYGDPRMQGEGGHFAVAKMLDSQAKASRPINSGVNPLVDVRTS